MRTRSHDVSKLISLCTASALLFLLVVFGKTVTLADIAQAAGLDSLPNGSYTITLTAADGTPFATGSLTVTGGGAGGTSSQLNCPAGTSGTYPNCVPLGATTNSAGTGASVTLDDGSSITASNGTPAISGTASGVTSLGVAIAPLSGGTAVFTKTVPVIGSRFTVAVTPALQNGSYLVRFSSGATSIYNAVLTVSGSSAGTLSNGNTTSSGASFVIGDRVQTIGNANVRSGASITASIVGVEPQGGAGSVLGGPVIRDNYEWWRVGFDNAVDGWTVKDNITRSNTPGACPSGVLGTYPNCATSPLSGDYTFTADKVSGTSPLIVTFNFQAPTGANPENLYIVRPFDNSSLNESNPYVYETPGTYTASLFVTSGTGANTQRATVKTLTIHVDPPTTTSGAIACANKGGTWSAPSGTGGVPSTTQPIESYMWYYPKTAADTGAASVGTQFTYLCRPYGTDLRQNGSYYNPGVVWRGPNNTYGVNSDVCAAAINAGFITESAGGSVQIERVAPQYVYPANVGATSPGTNVNNACTPMPSFKFLGVPTSASASGSAQTGGQCPYGSVGTYPYCNATPSSSTAFAVGGRVRTINASNIRVSPSTTGSLRGTHPAGILGTVIGGPMSADGYTWWNVDFDGTSSLDGWTVEDNLAASTVTQASVQEAANIAYNISQIPIIPAVCPANTTGTFPNCVSTVYDSSGNAVVMPNSQLINYSQYRPTNLGSAPVGSNMVFYCMPDGRTANNGTMIYLSHYQPYYTVYGGTGGVYSMYSDLCASAVQAGVITSADGGQFVIQPVAAQAVTGTVANGITSYSAQSSPAYKFASLLTGATSPARITSLSPTSGVSPFTFTVTASNIPPLLITNHTVRVTYTGGSSDAGVQGSYVFDQVHDAFASVGTKTITLTTPGTYDISLMQMISNASGVSYRVLDTKSITVTTPPPSVTVTYQDGYPLYANFQFYWLDPATYSLDDGSGNGSLQNLGYVPGGSVSTSRTYPSAGTYTIRLLKGSTEVLRKAVTLPHQ